MASDAREMTATREAEAGAPARTSPETKPDAGGLIEKEVGKALSRGYILGIETSCDESAAAVVARGSHTLSNVVASQIATHAPFGGVVPELASREHLRSIVPVVEAALAEADVTLEDLDAIAVTEGPGLAGALLVGITYAKALAFALDKPLIAVNHLEGHIHAVLLQQAESAFSDADTSAASDAGLAAAASQASAAIEPLRLNADAGAIRPASVPGSGTDLDACTDSAASTHPEPDAASKADPALALVVSGGHTHLYLARHESGFWRYRTVGRTVDDAAGEAFDKVAKLLGLGYPGGPWIDALARFGDSHVVTFRFAEVRPRPLRQKPGAPAHPDDNTPTQPETLFSFSGIKTSVLRYVEAHNLADAAAGRRQFLAANPSTRPPASLSAALELCDLTTLNLIASFQHAVVENLRQRTFDTAALWGARRILISGGVAANRELRVRFTAEATQRDLPIAFPSLALSTDNAAMIAAAAWPKFLSGEFASPLLSAEPALRLGC